MQRSTNQRPWVNRRLLCEAGAGLVLFAVWTLVVAAGIAAGGRPSVRIVSMFGEWPSSVDHVEHSSDVRLSIFATYRATNISVPGGATAPAPGLIGEAGIGTTVDGSTSNAMNGTRFTTGIVAGAVESMSVYVAGPIDVVPNDRFQLAIYDDVRGAPGRRVGKTGTGTLTADAWNTLAIDVVLRPRTAYWLMYNTNGSNAGMNNATFTPVAGDVLDDAIHAHATGRLDPIAWRLMWFGDNLPTATMMIALGAVPAVRRRRTAAAALLAGFAISLLIALVLREGTFAPYGLYPSGHALRTTYVAVAAASILPRRAVRAGGGLFVLLVAVALVYTHNHYSDEIIGGMALGWSMARAATAFGPEPPGRYTACSNAPGEWQQYGPGPRDRGID